MSSQSEKQMMAGLVAKVREVVHDVSNTDIILVLHNYDMDVQKAIQALCEDRENALGNWEHTGAAAAKKKNKKKKAKAAAASAVVDSASSNGGASPSSSTPASTPTPVVVVSKPPAVNTVPRVPETVSKPEKKVTPTQNADLSQHSSDLEQVASSFDRQITDAEKQVHEICQYIIQCVQNRESELIQEIHSSRSAGHQFLASRRSQLTSLKSKHDEATFKEFLAGIPTQSALGEAQRFSYDADRILDPLRSFGEIIAVKASSSKPAKAPAPKKSEPVSNGVAPKASAAPKAAAPAPAPVVQAPKKETPTNVVNDGGFVMGSDGLSADALAAIHASLQANLKAQGVDLSVVNDLTNGGFSAPRRRPNNGNGNNASSNGNKVAGGRGTKPVKA
ncbi:hypothetical protein L596_029611 [Steinernema carpocapsae]|uniref:CUE domain-containing protein n=1 Tax=Steinernema carpocapsae TaxID=34508 RepID=A0A4U5LV57_STECR|nr:hypothetical protein L596_029611 [Steinernema carpocapsae]